MYNERCKIRDSWPTCCVVENFGKMSVVSLGLLLGPAKSIEDLKDTKWCLFSFVEGNSMQSSAVLCLFSPNLHSMNENYQCSIPWDHKLRKIHRYALEIATFATHSLMHFRVIHGGGWVQRNRKQCTGFSEASKRSKMQRYLVQIFVILLWVPQEPNYFQNHRGALTPIYQGNVQLAHRVSSSQP